MAIGGIGGNEPIKEVKGPQSSNEVITRNQVSPEQISIFNKCDNDGNGKLEGTEVNSFKSMIANLRNKLMGGAEKAESKQTGTAEDVKNATNQPTTNSVDKFAEDGSYKTDVKIVDGHKEITTGGETVKVGDNSLDVTGQNGESIGGTKVLPNGMQVLTQPNGEQGVFDPKKGQFLPEEEAKKVLAEMS